MNGAELLVKTAIRAGVEVCFANPGTTEIPLVMALDSVPGMRAILGLFEGVCTGAADGYGRMTERPAMALLHHGPGFANGIANLHNARRAAAPVLNIVGDHTTWHRGNDAPLAMDIEALAGTVSGWVRRNGSPETLSQDVTEAVSAALLGQIATLIVPHDHQYAPCADATISTAGAAYAPLDMRAVDDAAKLIRSGKRTVLLLGGRALRREGLMIAAAIQEATGCDLVMNHFPGFAERGVGYPEVTRLPYFPEEALTLLGQYEAVVLAGMREPVTFFGYEGVPGRLLAESREKVHIGAGTQDVVEALGALADGLRVSKGTGKVVTEPVLPDLPSGDLTAEKACVIVAALQPENGIIVEEGITGFYSYSGYTSRVPAHSLITISGGSIGNGMPCATGAAVACPDRPVINIQADGSGMYTLQSLWTQAREGLNVKTLVISNRSYNIVKLELARAGITNPGPNALAMIELDHPPLDWPSMARGMGVPGVSVNTAGGLIAELRRALNEPGPYLIEMVI
jgi:acetolactate synthase-1/2/3 large subunit